MNSSWVRALANIPTPNPPIIARIAPSIIAMTISAWFSIHSFSATAAGVLGGTAT